MSKIVRHDIDLNNLPPLTEAQEAELKALSNEDDETIDFSDIPQLNEAALQNAVPNPFYKPKKLSTTVRIDADVLAWLKGQGKGYQTRLNKILRDAMLNALNESNDKTTRKQDSP